MNKYLRLGGAMLACCFLFFSPADASSWRECSGTAVVESATQDENGVWQLAARVEKAVMTDGFGRAGDDCAEAAGDIVIAADTAVAAGETVSFKYTYYGGMGPHGPVSARTWALVK